MPFYLWSQTPASNASADPTINFAEGQAPSSLNDSNRAVMAAQAKWGADISGAIVTSGSSTAYTVASNSVFDTLAHLSGQMIAFTPHATNAATVTLNVDSLGAKPLRSAPNVELQAGAIVLGTPYVAVYNNSDGAFYLRGFFGPSPSTIPLGGTLIWWDDVLPTGGAYTWCNGQVISASTVSPVLLARWGNRFGGDGVTTMGLPDLRETVPLGKNGMGGTTDRALLTFLGGAVNTVMNLVGLGQNTLGIGNLPPITSSAVNNISVTVGGGGTIPVNSGTISNAPQGSVGNNVPTAASPWAGVTTLSGSTNNNITVNSSGTTSTPVNNVQPSTVCNYVVRIQ